MRFPTEENTLSPHSHARNMTFTSGGSYSAHTTHSLRPRRDDHSLSPESTSDASSIYQIPTGLPHPKPKHNVKEQLHQVNSIAFFLFTFNTVLIITILKKLYS